MRNVEKVKELHGAFPNHVYAQLSWQIPLFRPGCTRGRSTQPPRLPTLPQVLSADLLFCGMGLFVFVWFVVNTDI